jgi:hypothetical protein
MITTCAVHTRHSAPRDQPLRFDGDRLRLVTRFCCGDRFDVRVDVGFRLTRSGNFAAPVSRFHSSNVSADILPLTSSSANLRRCAWLLNGMADLRRAPRADARNEAADVPAVLAVRFAKTGLEQRLVHQRDVQRIDRCERNRPVQVRRGPQEQRLGEQHEDDAGDHRGAHEAIRTIVTSSRPGPFSRTRDGSRSASLIAAPP